MNRSMEDRKLDVLEEISKTLLLKIQYQIHKYPKQKGERENYNSLPHIPSGAPDLT